MENILKKCDKGWHTGECCCNCKNQIELFKHPCNEVHKGCIDEIKGMYVCIAQFDSNHKNRGIIYEKPHGFCELYCSNDTKMNVPEFEPNNTMLKERFYVTEFWLLGVVLAEFDTYNEASDYIKTLANDTPYQIHKVFVNKKL